MKYASNSNTNPNGITMRSSGVCPGPGNMLCIYCSYHCGSNNHDVVTCISALTSCLSFSRKISYNLHYRGEPNWLSHSDFWATISLPMLPNHHRDWTLARLGKKKSILFRNLDFSLSSKWRTLLKANGNFTLYTCVVHIHICRQNTQNK